jgi:hypothetical protein
VPAAPGAARPVQRRVVDAGEAVRHLPVRACVRTWWQDAQAKHLVSAS